MRTRLNIDAAALDAVHYVDIKGKLPAGAYGRDLGNGAYRVTGSRSYCEARAEGKTSGPVRRLTETV